jgi:hypothetical protein
VQCRLILKKSLNTTIHTFFLKNRRCAPPLNNEKRGKIKKLFEELEEILKDHNQEKTDELKSFIKGGLPSTSKSMPTIIPVYALVLTEALFEGKGTGSI